MTDSENTIKDQADLSSFKTSNEVIKLVGELARSAYDKLDPNNLNGHSQEVWTEVEEVITGFENR